MPSRINIRDRLEQLEARIAPKGRVFVLHRDDGLPHAEQVAAFKAENGVKQHDHLVVVAFS